MATSDMMKKLMGAAVFNGLSFGIGYVHGRKGDMPKLGKTGTLAKVPADAVIGGVGYLAGLFGRKWIGETGSSLAMRAGDAGFGYFTGSLGAQAGQKARKALPADSPDHFTNTANDRTVMSGPGRRAMRANPRQGAYDPYTGLMGMRSR